MLRSTVPPFDPEVLSLKEGRHGSEKEYSFLKGGSASCKRFI